MTNLAEINLQNWAIVSYNDDTGLGRMAQDACAVLGFRRRLVIPSERLSTKPLQPGDILLKRDCPETEVEEVLEGLEGIISLERADWHPQLFPIARRMGISTTAVIMWEWFLARDPLWKQCDLVICPNQKALEIARQCGFSNSVRLPWALDLSRLCKRAINGPGQKFIHNAGLVDRDDRKGTRDTIQAFKRVADPHVHLRVHLQKEALLPQLDPRTELKIGNLDQPADLYMEGDVAIQPSKLEGIGFMVLEPLCCGIPTITQNIAPLNEYPIPPELLVAPRWLKRKATASLWVPHAHLRLPNISKLAKCIEWCASNDLTELSRQARNWAEEAFDPETLRSQWRSSLQKALHRRVSIRGTELTAIS